MNRQEIFTQVATHLLTQKRRSVKNGICQYQGPKGTSCAVGCLIPDEFYDPEIEDVHILYLKNYITLPDFFEEEIDTLSNLQDIHDNIHPRSWKKKLSEYASENHLEMPILK